MLRISNIKLSLEEDEKSLKNRIMHKYKIKEIKKFRISKKSIDARKKDDVHYVYSVDIKTENDKKYVGKNIQPVKNKKYLFPKGHKKDKPVVIVGMGPAGLMCGLTLVRNGYKVIMLERGKCVEDRKKDVDLFWKTGTLNTDSNVQFGEGGAGTFSDGKLTTGISDFRISYVLDEFYKHGAPEEILYLAKPHIGTDNLYKMVKNIRREIIDLGGDVRFLSALSELVIENDKITAVKVKSPEGEYKIETNHVVLAIGHSARDTFEMLKAKNVPMEQKNFSIGARIEHSQEMINKSQYGENCKKLGAADYKIAVHLDNGRSAYTFCMCPGGFVVASASEAGGVVTNGMSYFDRDGDNANSALLVNVTPSDFGSDDVLAGMYMQREIERKAFKAGGSNYNAPAQRVGSFLGKEETDGGILPTYRPGVTWTQLDKVLPEFIIETMREAIVKMDKKLHGFADSNAVLTAPETRSSSPVRIVRNSETLQSEIAGLFPCGEGAGYAGGITSAAVDGVKAAEMVAKSE